MRSLGGISPYSTLLLSENPLQRGLLKNGNVQEYHSVRLPPLSFVRTDGLCKKKNAATFPFIHSHRC
jgi:hypothetical protein